MSVCFTRWPSIWISSFRFARSWHADTSRNGTSGSQRDFTGDRCLCSNCELMFMIVGGSKVLREIGNIQLGMKREDLFLSFGSIATLPLTARDTSPTHP